MSGDSQHLDAETNDSQQKRATGLTRRRIVLLGGAGLAGLTTAAIPTRTSANTQRPVAPATGSANPNGSFAGKVVLITGATSGIGEGTAKAFAHEGAKVYFCGRRENLGNQVQNTIRDLGGDATYLRADVRREEDVRNLVDECVRRYGRVDIAFNNAGIVNPRVVNLHEQTSADFLDSLNTNTVGVFLCMKYEIPVMLQQNGGIIINTASISAHKGFTGRAPYSASKHGILALTKVAALEYAKNNIRVCSISPGGVDTPMLRQVLEVQGLPFSDAANAIPIGRVNTVEEMARTVMFLASDDASALHGSNVDVTSGELD